MTRANLAEIATRRAQGSAAMVTFVRNVSLPLAGFVSPARPAPPAVFLGNQKAFPGAFSHVAEARKHVLSGEGVCLVPTVVYLPHNVSAAVPAPAVMLVARKAGSALSPALTSLVDAFAGAGYVVVVPDLCGFGEAGDAFTTTSFGKGAGGCEQMATELGRSVAGIHAADVQRAAAHALALPEVSALAATVALDHTMTAVLLASFLGGDARPALGRLALVAPVASFSENAVCNEFWGLNHGSGRKKESGVGWAGKKILNTHYKYLPGSGVRETSREHSLLPGFSMPTPCSCRSTTTTRLITGRCVAYVQDCLDHVVDWSR